MKHQTRRPDQWIVVDDGEKPMKDMNGFEYVRRKPKQLILNLHLWKIY